MVPRRGIEPRTRGFSVNAHTEFRYRRWKAYNNVVLTACRSELGLNYNLWEF
jgi:hypothetical protein